MADEPTFDVSTQPTLQQLVDYFVAKITDPDALNKFETVLANGSASAGATMGGYAQDLVEGIVKVVGVPVARVILQTLLGFLRGGEPLLDDIGKLAIDAVLGEGPARGRVPDDIGARILQKLAPPGGAVTPGLEGAQHYLTIVASLQLETWLLDVLTEAFAESIDLVRGGGSVLESVGQLREVVTQVMGGGRITRRVLAPFIDDGIVTPAKWATQKQYRPTLLSVNDAVRQFLRGRWTNEQMREELARQGWSEDRIEALVNGQRKFFSAADTRTFLYRGWWTNERATRHLQDQGYTEDEAADVLRLEGLRRFIQQETTEADAIVAAYAAGDIDESTMSALFGRYLQVDAERELYTELAELRRTLNVKRLSPTDVRRLVVKGVLSVIDYRLALEHDNWATDAIDALELELRADLDAAKTVEQHKAEQAAEKARQQEQAAADKAAKEAELAARKALPTLQEYRRAYVRGLISRDAFRAAIVREKIAIAGDDLDLLLGDADTDRATYVAEQEKRAAADTKKPDPALPLATYESSVLRGILTIDQYAAELQRRGFDQGEQDVAVSLLRDRLAQQDEAATAKADAEQRAALKSVSLPTFERAVRLGVRTIDDYAAFLDTIETPEVAKALILDLLRAQLAEDDQARQQRAAREAEARKKGIALSQRRRAVLAGTLSRDGYAAALRDAGWPPDDQRIELALLDAELAEAREAQARRDQIEQEQAAAKAERDRLAAEKAAKANEPPPAPSLSIAQLERAVKLGLLAPDDLRAELTARGYAAEDVELMVSLVIAGLPDTRTAQTLETTVAAQLASKSISLADLQAGVLHALKTLDQYAADLLARGYGADDVELLRQLLADRVALEQGKLQQQIAARLAKTEGAPPLAEILDAVTSGEVSGDQLVAILQSFGVDGTTATLFARMVLVFGAEA